MVARVCHLLVRLIVLSISSFRIGSANYKKKQLSIDLSTNIEKVLKS